MYCPKCKSELKEIHSSTIANVEFENISRCTNEECDYEVETNCGATREYYKGEYI